MPFDIKIYGDIDPTPNRKGCCSLVDVQNQLSKAEGQEIRVRISSYGGDVDEGFAIYSELRRYAQDNKVRVITMAEGRCASIATVIFLAGDERIVSRYIDPFVHNASVRDFSGNANEMRATADELDRIDKMIATHYSEHTNLTFDEALKLMGADTSLKPSECQTLRFATKIETVPRPIALKEILNKQGNTNNEYNMDTKNKKERWSLLNSVAKGLGINIKGFINKIVFTADSKEIDFYELGEDEIVEVGAKATIDGKPADGEWIVPDVESGKSKKYIFEAGTLTDIQEEDAASDEDMEALQAKVAELEAENEALKSNEAALNKEVEESATVLNSLNEKYAQVLKERDTFKAKIDNAKSHSIVDPKEKSNQDGKKSKYLDGIAKTANINLNRN